LANYALGEEVRAPATPVAHDTNIEDIETLDSIIANKTPSPQQKGELARLAQLMLDKSPNVRVSYNNWQVASLALKSTRAALFPSLTALSKTGQMGIDPNTRGPTNNYGHLELTAAETLYDNGVTWTNIDIAKSAEQRMRLEYEYQRDTTLLQALQTYLDWSQALQTQDLDEAKRKILRRQYNFMESQFRQGLSSRRDVLRLDSELRRLLLDQLTRQTEIQIARQKLLSLIGASNDEFAQQKIEGEETGAVDEPALGTEQELSFQTHPRNKIQKLSEQEANLTVRLAQRDYWPHINLQADGSYVNDEYFQPTKQFDRNYVASWDALLVLSWTIWDWGIKSRAVQIARIGSETVTQKNRQEALDIEVQLQTITRSLLEKKEGLTVSHELMTLEQQNYNALENDYRNGRSSYLDLIGSINFYIDARTRNMIAYFDLRRQKLAYDFHRGNLFTVINNE
jgi:outer membrane protein TolC